MVPILQPALTKQAEISASPEVFSEISAVCGVCPRSDAARFSGRRISSCTAAASPGSRLAAAPRRGAMDADHHVPAFVHRQRHLRALVRARRVFQPNRPGRTAAAPRRAGLGPEQRHPIAVSAAVAAPAHGRIQRHSVISHRESPSLCPFAGLCRKPAVSSYAPRSALVLNLQIRLEHVIIIRQAEGSAGSAECRGPFAGSHALCPRRTERSRRP